jgi:peptidyl-prolyl cis-trans isomerase D
LDVNSCFSPIFALHFNLGKNMQVIQTIRDKGAAVVIAVIALSLIGFLLMDANSGTKGSGGFFNSLSSNVGKVDGEAIEKSEFDKKYTSAYAMAGQQAQQQGRSVDAGQVRDQVWNQMVAENIFYREAAKLGIDFTSKELSAILSSNDQGNPLLQDKEMIDPATGQLDQAKVAKTLTELKKAKGDRRDMIDEQLLSPQKLTSTSSKYFALLNASAYYPAWMQEKDNTEAKTFANISYVSVPYGVISDSTITVTDAEIESYVSKHKNQFKQEAGRMISYVTFSQLPNGEDSAKTRELVNGLKTGMETETNLGAFLARNASAIPLDTSFKPKSKISSTIIDTLTKLPVGTVYGPYVENGSYVLAKVLATKVAPDSAKARHILIGTVNPQTGQPILEDSVAKKLADSILAAIKAGADFGAMVTKYSTDEGSKDKAGFYDYFEYGKMMPDFNDFSFTKPAGTQGIVKTPFGYHVIEAMGTKGSSTLYKVAFMAKEIFPSEATISTANLNATKLSGQKGGKDFEAYLAKNGLQKITWPSVVKENDYTLGQMRDANIRTLVKWVYDAKEGDVSEPFNIGDEFIVATVDKIQSEGTQDAKTARMMVQGVIRNQKKAEQIIKKLGANPTLEKAAADYQQQIATAGADSSLIFSSRLIAGLGEEPKVIGASFNKENQTKVSAPIEGGTGVFLIKVNSIGTKPADAPEVAAQQKTQQTTAQRTQTGTAWFEGLKNQATIKDNRSKYY